VSPNNRSISRLRLSSSREARKALVSSMVGKVPMQSRNAPAQKHAVVAYGRRADAQFAELRCGQLVDIVIVLPIGQVDPIGIGHDNLADFRLAFEPHHDRALAASHGVAQTVGRDVHHGLVHAVELGPGRHVARATVAVRGLDAQLLLFALGRDATGRDDAKWP